MPDDPNAAAKPKGERLKAPKPNFDHFRSNGDSGFEHPDDQPGARNGRSTDEPAKKLLVTRLSHVSVEPVIWFWRDRVPLGALTILAGEPDSGKTALLLDLIARSTTGGQWPNGEGTAKRGMWVYVTTENDTVRTIKPRLIAAGGDVSQVVVVKGVDAKDRRKPREQRGFDLSQDLADLDSLIEHGFNTDHADCIGVAIDPLNEFLGSGTNSWKDSDVRRVLGPLVALAERRQIAVVGIMHPNKNSEANSLLNKIIGSTAFAATARTVHYAARDDEAGDQGEPQFVLTMAKNNLGPKPTSLAYALPTTRIEPSRGDDPAKAASVGSMVFVRWLGPTDRSAADVVFKKDEPESRSAAAHRDAITWLQLRLGNDRVPVKVVEQDAKDSGIKRAAFRFACEALNVRRERDSFGGAYLMSLPPREPGRGTPFGRHDADDTLAL
jgi:hypothetical protein